MKLLYVTNSFMPSQKANAIHSESQFKYLSELVDTTMLYKVKSLKDNVETDNKNRRGLLCLNNKLFIIVYAVMAVIETLRIKPEVVYTRDIYYAFLLSLATNYTFIIEIHNLYRNDIYNIILKRLISDKKCRKIVCISNNLKNDVVNVYNTTEKKLIVLPDAAEPNDLSFKVRRYSKNAVYTGSLYEGKGIEFILELAALMKDITFDIYGGPEKIWYDKYLSKSSENVQYYGWVDREQIKIAQASAGVLLLPNERNIYTNNGRDNIGRYTSPLKLYEYMASGSPFVCSRISNYKIFDTDVCLYADVGDHKEWEGCIRSALSNSSNIHQLRFNAHKLFHEKFTWHKRSEMIISLF